MSVLRVSSDLDTKLLRLVFRDIIKKAKKGFTFWRCPICDWPFLNEDPADGLYNICTQCGVEFGLEDHEHSWEELRENWAKYGKPFGRFQWEAVAERSDLAPNQEPANSR